MIAAAEAFLVRLPYRLGVGRGWDGTLDHVLLRLETRDGVVGWGEAFGYRAAAATLAALREIVVPLALALDDLNPVAANRRLQRACHQGGRAGPLLFAIAAVDIALWDIAGKRQGVPITDLLGGVKRAPLPAYSSLLHYGDAGAVAEGCRRSIAAGYAAVKLHDTTYEAVAAAREAVGEDVKLMIDVNCAWDPQQATREIARLRAFDPHWVEEPIYPPEDTAALARLARETGVDIAAGENAATPADFAALMDAVSFVQPSVTKVGGITPMVEILRAADARGVRAMPHSPYFGPGLLATLHVLASRDDSSLAEIYDPAELAGNPYGTKVAPIGGTVSPPSGPGLGLDPDEAVIREYSGSGERPGRSSS